MLANRAWLTPFSAPPESTGSPEVNSETVGANRLSTRPAAFQLKADLCADLTRASRGLSVRYLLNSTQQEGAPNA